MVWFASIIKVVVVVIIIAAQFNIVHEDGSDLGVLLDQLAAAYPGYNLADGVVAGRATVSGFWSRAKLRMKRDWYSQTA